MVASNIADCSDVLSVYDYSNPADIKLVKSFAAKDLGYDQSSALRTCDVTGKTGVNLAPHGVGTSAATGEAFHFITGTGQVALIDIDAETPTVRLIQTSGSGGSTAKDMPGGRFIVVPQRTPREVQDKAGGILCQIGQIAVIDAVNRQLVSQTPILYGNGACNESLVGKPGAAAAVSYLGFNKDGSRMFVAVGTLSGPQNVAATVDLVPVFDMTDPSQPKQLEPLKLEARKGSDIVMANGGRLAFIPNSEANTVSIVDTESMKTVKPSRPSPARRASRPSARARGHRNTLARPRRLRTNADPSPLPRPGSRQRHSNRIGETSMRALIAAPLALLVAIAPAGACDPEDLKAEYRSLCATPTDAVAQLVAASSARLGPDIATSLAAKAKEAQAMCLADKYDDAMRLAVRIAKALGAAEHAAGVPREQLTQAPGSFEVVAR